MKLTRYEDTAPVDYMILAEDGNWVPASEALELAAEVERLWVEKQADCIEYRDGVRDAQLAQRAAESRLAAATDVVKEWRAADPTGKSVMLSNLEHALGLAAQPAAPARSEQDVFPGMPPAGWKP